MVREGLSRKGIDDFIEKETVNEFIRGDDPHKAYKKMQMKVLSGMHGSVTPIEIRDIILDSLLEKREKFKSRE